MPGFELYRSCKHQGEICDAKHLNEIQDGSPLFVALVTDEYEHRANCMAELSRARTRRVEHGRFPIIVPVILEGVSDEALTHLGFVIDQAAGTGEVWTRMSGGDEWERAADDLRERLLNDATRHMLVGNADIYQDLKHLDLILAREHPTSLEMRFVQQACRADDLYARYFFNKVQGVAWFAYLDAVGFFRAGPGLVEDERHKGTMMIPTWPVLLYLERLCQELVASGDQDHFRQLLATIRRVTRPPQGDPADNATTWWYFTKMMSRMPTTLYTLDDVRMARVWIGTRAPRMSLVVHDITTIWLPALLASTSSVPTLSEQ